MISSSNTGKAEIKSMNNSNLLYKIAEGNTGETEQKGDDGN
jgi:hypothetical protein